MNFWPYHKFLGVKNDTTFWRNGQTFAYFLSNQTANLPTIKNTFHVMHCFMLYMLISQNITLKLRGFYSNTSVEPPSGDLICTCVCESSLVNQFYLNVAHHPLAQKSHLHPSPSLSLISVLIKVSFVKPQCLTAGPTFFLSKNKQLDTGRPVSSPWRPRRTSGTLRWEKDCVPRTNMQMMQNLKEQQRGTIWKRKIILYL